MLNDQIDSLARPQISQTQISPHPKYHPKYPRISLARPQISEALDKIPDR